MVKPYFHFSKQIIEKINQLNTYEGFLELLDKASITPSYKTMKGNIYKWYVEAFTNSLI